MLVTLRNHLFKKILGEDEFLKRRVVYFCQARLNSLIVV